MTKQEFIIRLREGLSGLPQDDIAERLSFYGEMIDDRMEDGLSEEAAVGNIGAVEDIAAQIIADTPLTKLVKEKMRPPKTFRVWEIILLVLGAPIWLPLIFVAIAVALSVYAVVWSVVLCLWAFEVSLGGCALSFLAAGVYFACTGHTLTGIAVAGAGLVCVGLSIFLFFGCRAATRGVALLSKKLSLGIKHCFIRKEAA